MKHEFDFLTQDDVATSLIFQSGFSSVLSFDKKDALMKELCHYHVIDRPRSVLEQFKDGLKTLGILGLIQKHPAQFEALFCSQGRCNTPECVDMLFHVEYAVNGTMEKERQEFIVMLWRDYLQGCAGTKSIDNVRSNHYMCCFCIYSVLLYR